MFMYMLLYVYLHQSGIQLERRVLTMLQWLHLPDAERSGNRFVLYIRNTIFL